MRTLSTVLLATLALAPTAAGQAVVDDAARERLAVTVYRGWAHVRDARRVPAAGEIAWTSVPDLDPGTLLASLDGRPIELSGARFEPPASAHALLLRGVGGPATLLAPSGERIEATIVSPDGPVFRVGDRLLVGWDGPIELPGGVDSSPGGRIVFATERPAAGVLTLSYLAEGLGWSADYVAVLEDGGAMTLRGHATIENRTAHDFPDAAVELVAGDVRRAGDPSSGPRVAEMAVARADAGPERESFSDRVLYRLPGRATIPAGSTSRVPLFGAARLDVERDHLLDGEHWSYRSARPAAPTTTSPSIRLSFAVEGLAEGHAPLPAGRLHLHERGPDGTLRFAGSAPVPDLPDGERAEIVVGAAFDLVAERVQTAFRRIDERTVETAWRLEVRNRGDDDRVVTVREPVPGEWTILEESRPHERVDAGTVVWRLPVPGRGSATLEWRVRSTS